MRVASYNLYEGAQQTYSQLIEFAVQQELDVLCLQEANGWNEGSPSKMEDFARAAGFTAAVYGDSNTRFKLATFSKRPIISSSVHTEGFWHSTVHTVIDQGGSRLNLWNHHFDPTNEDRRLGEAQRVVSLINLWEPTILVGDYNSLSRADDYPDELAGRLAANGITKFGKDGLRYDMTDYLGSSGLVDVAAALGNRETTVPTPANQDSHHAAPMRLDYVFATESAARTVTGITVPKNRLTDTISDHYPVILTLED